MPHLRLAALAACLVLSACSARSPRPAEPAARTVVLVSIDAFRADYLSNDATPNLARIAREGTHAAWMNPSYPSLTFPNHYTLATGLRPDHHGVIHNRMSDSGIGDARSRSGRPRSIGPMSGCGRSAQPLLRTSSGVMSRTDKSPANTGSTAIFFLAQAAYSVGEIPICFLNILLKYSSSG